MVVKNKFKSRRTLRFILPFLILLLSAEGGFFTANATVRYVSHSGTNTPPYTSWATAADSIMFAINISEFGDTIYVANGVYKEQVVMIPGLTLIGAGMDSCVIDTRNFIRPIGFSAVIVADSCVLKGFNIIVSNGRESRGITSGNGNAVIEFNKISNTNICIYIPNSNTLIQENIINNVKIGIQLSNSGSTIKNNQIINVERGILVDAVSGEYKPIIEQNLITTELFGVLIFFSSSPTIRSNIIFLNGDGATGYQGSGSDTAWVYNNLVVSPGDFDIRRGFVNTIVPTFEYNNFLIGDFSSYGIYAVDFNIIKNNVIMNSPLGITIEPGHNPTILYNNSWNNDTNYGGFTPDSTNLSVNPMIVNEDTTLGELDFHLQMFSPLIDAGDPNILDVDGSRSDIGLYGGPFGESYTYQDLAPKPPRNLSAVVDSEYITLSWNGNTEADFKSYNLFRDTTANFTADSTTLVSILTDTFYIQIIPNGIEAFYYKLTATDKPKLP